MKNILIILSLIISVNASAIPTKKFYLSGTGSDNTKTWDFYCSDGQNSRKWSKIQVPSCWEQQGFGNYTYGRFYKTKGLRPSDETGIYRTSFTIPKEETGKMFQIVFEGVMTDTKVCIDGKMVGQPHQGGFTEFSYDITDFVRPGKKQTLEVTVSKESANASVNSAERRADWWLFGGIYRPVYIQSLPEKHISNVSIDARGDGTLIANVTVSPAAKGIEPVLYVDGKRGQNESISYSSADSCYILKAEFPGISQWDPEHPNLHDARISLSDGSHSVDERIGFRTIDFRSADGIYLNGVKLIVKGTNRHCFHPETGRAVSKDLSVDDVKLLKSMNMNAVRCHYPSDRHFLEACDSLGLLYLDEFPGWQTHYDDTTACKLLPEFILRDVNRPSVFIWANGNEGGWNTTVDDLFSTYDIQKRKVIHPWADFNDIDTHHYPAYQTGAHRLHKGTRVFMPTEFMHGQYDKGQGAGLEDFWDHWTASPLFAGGFIWAFVDEAVRRTDLPTGKSKGRRFGSKNFDITDCILDSDGGNAPDGCVDAYRQPEASVYTIREVWSPIYIDRLNVTESFDGRIPVENRWLFTRLGECSMMYKIKNCNNGKETVVKSGNMELPDIEPGERSFARMPIVPELKTGDILELTAFGPEKEEICSWSAMLPWKDHYPTSETDPTPGSLSVEFDDNGLITEIRRDGKIIPFANGPLPVGMLAECIGRKDRTEADGTQITTFHYKGGIDSIRWSVTPRNELKMHAVLLNSESGHGFRKNFLTEESGWTIGLTFNYPDSIVKKAKWLGKGPYRVWRNREKGMNYGVWEKDYNNTVTGEYGTTKQPVYPEFKGYHADVKWMELEASGNKGFRVTSDTENLYVRLFTPSEPGNMTTGEMGGLAEKHNMKKENTMVKFPQGDISFLLSIPPIRSYKPLQQQGPQSMPDVIRIKKGDTGLHINLTFDFN